jgi:hypothetical protein
VLVLLRFSRARLAVDPRQQRLNLVADVSALVEEGRQIEIRLQRLGDLLR